MAFWRRTGLRVVAMVLAAVLCADVTLDAACDPVVLPGPATAAAVSPDETGSAGDLRRLLRAGLLLLLPQRGGRSGAGPAGV